MDLADSEDALRDDGFAGEFLDHYMLEARFGVRGFSGAYWAADDGEVDSVALLRRMAAFARDRGARLFEASQVSELAVEDGGVRVRTARGEVHAGLAVLALGAGAGPLLSTLGPAASAGLTAHLATLSAHRLTFALDPGTVLPSPARSVDGSLAFRVSRDLRVAAFPLPVHRPNRPRPSGVFKPLASTHLSVSSDPLARWSGPLLTTLDDLPLVGPLEGLPVAVLLGLGALGHSWAFVAARWIAEGLTGQKGVPPLFRVPRPPLRTQPGPREDST